MLRISCPYCGQRDETEYSYGGESHLVRPGPDSSDAIWADYLFNRDNTKGPYHERWCHTYGCGRWFNVKRDTTSNEVLAVYPMGSPPPRRRTEGGDR